MPYLQNATHEGFIFNEATKAEFAGNGTHAAMAMQYFVANLPTGQLDANNQPIYANYNIGQAVGFYSSNGTGANLTEVYANPLKLAISTKETELSNVTVWSANSILTQSRGNSLYIADSTVLTGVPMSYGNDVFYGYYHTRNRAPGFPFVAGSLLTGSAGVVGVANTTDPCNIEFLPGDIFNQMRFRSYNQSLLFAQYGFIAETGTANWTWSANSILTQGRADSRYQANGSYLNDLLTTVPMSYGSDALAGMRKSAGSPANFVAGPTSVGGFATVGIVAGNEVSAVEFGTGDIFATLRLRQYKHTLLIADDGILVETGTANWTWSANSILTQGRADSRYYFANNPSNYLPSANFTYANLGGTIPTATNTTLGAIKVGSNLTIANGVLSATSSGGVTAAKAIAYSIILGR
jgi:hypothetical protein